MRFCVLHNLYFYNKMMEEIREAIEAGRYKEYKEEKLRRMAEGEQITGRSEKSQQECRGILELVQERAEFSGENCKNRKYL